MLLCGPSTPTSIIPAQAGICRELSHGLDELIHLRAEQHFAIASLQRLDSIGRADIPVLHGDLIGCAMNRQPQIVGLAADHEVQWIDASVERYLVGRATAVLDHILSIAAAKEEGILAATTVYGIVPQTATQDVVAGKSRECVVAAVAGDDIIECVAGAIQVLQPGQRQVLDISPQRIVDRGLHHVVGAGVQRFCNDVGGHIHNIGIVAQASGHLVRAGSTIEGIVARPAEELVVAVQAHELVVPAVAGEDVGEFVAGAVNVIDAKQGQVLNIVLQREVRRKALHEILAPGGADPCFGNAIIGAVHHVGIVARAAIHDIVAHPAVEGVIAQAAIHRVAAVRANEDIGAGAPSDVH